MKPFRILSVDGGGIKGVFPAAFLAALERTSELRMLEKFDLIVGTSTGGILALGLGLGFTGEQMLQFYCDHGPRIFPARRWSWRLHALKSLFRHRYDPGPLRAALEGAFGDRRLGEAKVKLVIPATSAATGDVYIYKTPHHPRFVTDQHERVVDVALATAAAPTYFPPHTGPSGATLLDGGLWANNPVMVGVVEALAVLEQPKESIRVLSLGCTTSPIALGSMTRRNGGVASWAKPAVEWLGHGQAVAATNQARLLLGKQNVLRVQPKVPPRLFALDDASAIDTLVGLGTECARTFAADVNALLGPICN